MASVVDLFAGVGLVSTAFELEGSVVLASDYSVMKEEIHALIILNQSFCWKIYVICLQIFYQIVKSCMVLSVY